MKTTKAVLHSRATLVAAVCLCLFVACDQRGTPAYYVDSALGSDDSSGVRVKVDYAVPVTMPFLGMIIGSQEMKMSATMENAILSPICP